MSSSFPPSFDSAIFNTSAFNYSGSLTLDEASKYFLKLTGGSITYLNVVNNLDCASLTIAGNAVDLSLLTGVTAGTPAPSKVLSLDASSFYNGDFKITGEIFMSGNAKDIHIDGIGSKVNIAGLGAGIILSSTTSSIVMNSTLTNSISTQGGISLSGIIFGSTQAGYLTSITPGTAAASKAVILDSSLNIQNINNITSTGIIANSYVNNTGSLLNYQTWTNAVGTPIVCNLQMSSTLPRFGTSSAHPFRIMSANAICAYFDTSGNCAIGTAAPNASYKLDVSGNINMTGGLYKSGIDISTAITGLTLGATIASKVLSVDASRNINNLNWIYATSNYSTSMSQNCAFNMYNGSTFLGLGLDSIGGTTFRLGECAANGGAWSGNYSSLRVQDLQINMGGGDWIKFSRIGASVKAGIQISNYFSYVCNDINSTILTSSGSSSYPWSWPSKSISYLGTDFFTWGLQSVGSAVGNAICTASKTTQYYDFTTLIYTQSNTNHQLIQKRVRIDNAVTDTSMLANLSIKCDSTNVVDAVYSNGLNIESLDATPITFQIQLNRNSGSTSTNAAFLGTYSANNLGIMTGNIRAITIGGTNQYVGIGTASPACPLDVNGNNGIVFGAGGFNVYSFAFGGGSTSVTSFGLGPLSVAISIRASNSITCSSLVQTSDRRLKENIKPLEIDLDKFYELNPIKYNLIGENDINIGLIAQDVLNAGFTHLVGFVENPFMKAKDEVLVDHIQLVLKYDRITMINMMQIKKLMKKNEILESDNKEKENEITSLKTYSIELGEKCVELQSQVKILQDGVLSYEQLEAHIRKTIKDVNNESFVKS